jgi:hypothetical protein
MHEESRNCVNEFESLRGKRAKVPEGIAGWNCLIEENKALLDVIDQLKSDLISNSIRQNEFKKKYKSALKSSSLPGSPIRCRKMQSQTFSYVFN